MDSEKSDTFSRRMEAIVRDSVHVELMPVDRRIDVEPYCGPTGDHVRINWYELTTSMFLSPGEALAVADAIKTAAARTANPPEGIQ